MKALLQRVSSASVDVDGERIASIGPGLLVFLGVERGDDEQRADTLLNRVLTYRVFPDEAGRMNVSLQDAGAALLVVPQFTLAADTRRGRRPSFSTAGAPDSSQCLYEHFLAGANRATGLDAVQGGRFGADMQVSLVNDGPVTFLLEN